MSTPKPLIHSLARQELIEFCLKSGFPRYRADQIFTWLYSHRVADFSAMRNLPPPLRTLLGGHFDSSPLEQADIQTETGTLTHKILARLRDGQCVEEVIIPSTAGKGRQTVCISSQAGCRFHCAFCASGQGGFTRNLEIGEIVGQEVLADRICADKYGVGLSNVVFMGIGEPFDNYDNVLGAIRIMNDPKGMGIGARRFTISTCGIPSGIRRLAEEKIQVELSVSLHAPDDTLRSQLMPVNRKYPLSELLQACSDYTGRTRRLITFEYTLIRNVNNTIGHAESLARLANNGLFRVNIIPLSPVSEFDGAAPEQESVRRFAGALEKKGVNVTLRASKGSALQAACGQLRAHTLTQAVRKQEENLSQRPQRKEEGI